MVGELADVAPLGNRLGTAGGAAAVLAALRRSGFAHWFEASAGPAFATDPWTSFEKAQGVAGEAGGALRGIAELFVRGEAVGHSEAERALSDAALEWLLLNGVLTSRDGALRSTLCLLATPGQFLLADWPLRTACGRLISQRTYLSTVSYDFAAAVAPLGRRPRGLDLGCGTGILANLLAGMCDETVAVDTDPRAIWLSRVNLAVNGRHARLVHESWERMTAKEGLFDVILANPPWRIVPAGIRYPDPQIRVGSGPDGLDAVRAVLAMSASHLAAAGRAIIRFDMLRAPGRPDPLLLCRRSLSSRGIELELISLGRVDVCDQAQISAGACAHLNPGRDDLAASFIDEYSAMGVRWLEPVLCIMTRGGTEALSSRRAIARRASCSSGIPRSARWAEGGDRDGGGGTPSTPAGVL